jgi:hypothetical protein
MARKLFKPRQHESGTVVTTKTPYGSDSSMVVDISQYKSISINTDEVVCKDDRGFYITKKNRIDSGMADPNRYNNYNSRINLEEAVEETSST